MIDSHSSDGQALLSEALYSLEEGVAVVDREFRFQWVNRWLERANGARMPLVGNKCYEVLRMLGEPCSDCPVRTCMESGENVSRVVGYTLGDGSTNSYEISASRFGRGKDQERLTLVRFRDVAGAVRVDEVLRAEVAFRRILVEQSSDGIVVLDEDGAVVESNLRFAQMIGYTMGEMPALHVWNWESTYPKDEVLQMLKDVDSSGASVVTRHRRKDGSFYEVEIHTNGAVIGGRKYIFCICRDVSEAKQAEREREALIQELRDALSEITVLRGILPVCSYCKKVRDDQGYWEQVDVYMQKHAIADVSHGICPDCMKIHFPDMRRDNERGDGN